MKILMIEWDSFGKEDIEEAFCAEGHDLVLFPVSIDGDLDTSFEIRQRLLVPYIRRCRISCFLSIIFQWSPVSVMMKVSGTFPGFMMRRMPGCIHRQY